MLFQCPYCHKDKENLSECVWDKGFCLVQEENGEMQLDRKHSYYYQLQAQLHIMEVEYCDFGTYLSIYLSIYLSTYLPIFLPIYLIYG